MVSPALHFDFNKIIIKSDAGPDQPDLSSPKEQIHKDISESKTSGAVKILLKPEGCEEDSKETTFQTSQQQLIERVVDRLCRFSEKMTLNLPESSAQLEGDNGMISSEDVFPKSCPENISNQNIIEEDKESPQAKGKIENKEEVPELDNVAPNDSGKSSAQVVKQLTFDHDLSNDNVAASMQIKTSSVEVETRPIETSEIGTKQASKGSPEETSSGVSTDAVLYDPVPQKTENATFPSGLTSSNISEIQNIVGQVDTSCIENCDSDEVAAAVGLLSLPFKTVVSPSESMESGEEADDGEQGNMSQTSNPNSEGRRSSSRACKGQRYREFMMEGGLTRGRKGRRGMFKYVFVLSCLLNLTYLCVFFV